MDIITLMEDFSILTVVKLLIVTLLGVYSIFAFLMMKQIGAMTRVVMLSDDFVLRLLGIGHFVFAVLVMVIAITIL